MTNPRRTTRARRTTAVSYTCGAARGRLFVCRFPLPRRRRRPAGRSVGHMCSVRLCTPQHNAASGHSTTHPRDRENETLRSSFRHRLLSYSVVRQKRYLSYLARRSTPSHCTAAVCCVPDRESRDFRVFIIISVRYYQSDNFRVRPSDLRVVFCSCRTVFMVSVKTTPAVSAQQ